MLSPPTIIIADDHVTYRNGLSDTLTTAGMQVVAVAGNGLQLIELAKQYGPDVVFIDLRMPGMDGVAACAALQELFPQMGKIAITYYDPCHPDVQKILLAGARGFLWKTADVDEIIRCTHAVLHGDTHYDGSCRPVLNALFSGQVKPHHLDDKQEDLLRLIGDELTSEQIARIVNKSPHTIEAWRHNLSEKCGVKTLVGLVKFGVKHGIIKL